jgi:anaerobic magnesium-protoporphyrin IX monomethyl ester cyclase
VNKSKKVKSVVLVTPPMSLKDRYGKDMQTFGGLSEPLGLAYIAGYLESRQISVRIIDAAAEELSINEVAQNIAASGDDIVGVTLLTTTFSAVAQLIQGIRKINHNCLIVVGGPHATALPERTLKEIPEADIVCIGEGELTMAEIAECADDAGLNAVSGICYREKVNFVRSKKRPFIKDLDIIPPPARHLLPISKYRLTASRVSGDTFCPTIIVARGCPFACTYCSRTFGRTFRSHSIHRIISEIQILIEQFNVTQINIEADTLTVKKTFLHDLCNAMIDKGFNRIIRWTCESRVDTVDADSLDLMKRAGCWQISYGVETGSQRLLDLINKGVTLKQVEDAFHLTKKAGITIRGFFMLGLPTETLEESMATIAFAKKLDPLWAQFTITVPYPGTGMFQELEDQGKIRTYDWSCYNTWSGWKGEKEIPFVPDGRTIEELADLQKKALRSFYLRPSVAWKFIKSIQTIHDVKKFTQGFMVLVKSAALRHGSH